MADPLLQQHGVLVLDKPTGPTSTRCLEMIKRTLRQRKIGHAGTLDPMARGVLLVLLGQATRLATYLTEGGKVYSGRLRLGLSTDTYDMEGQVTQERPTDHLDQEDVVRVIAGWIEQQVQIVPPYSAAKHKGKPLYKLSREGVEPPVKTKALHVTRAEVLELDLPLVRFRVECGPGTYIRSLVHSLGIRLGCGAVLTDLTREYSHPFGLEQAHALSQVLEEPDRFAERVLPLHRALPHWQQVRLTGRLAAQVRQGAAIGANEADAQIDSSPGRRAVFFDAEGAPLALAEVRLTNGKPVWAVLRGLWQS